MAGTSETISTFKKFVFQPQFRGHGIVNQISAGVRERPNLPIDSFHDPSIIDKIICWKN